MKPACVIFDFGGVISFPQRPRYFDELSRMLGPAADKLRAAYRRGREDYDRGTLDGPRYWRGVLAEVGVSDGASRVDDLIEFDTASWTSINEATLQEVRRLREAGCRTAVLSNMPWEIGLHIRRRWPWLKELFDVVTFSCEIGMIKPEPAIYRHTLRRLDLDAGECLFVDDTERNVAGARAVGLPALHFGRVEDLREALAR